MSENFRILKPFFRGLPIIVLSMILGVIVSKKYLTYVTPMNESTAKIKLADISEGISNSNLFKNFDVFASANKIAAEIEVLKSSALINKALSTLDFNTEIYRVGDFQTVELYNNSPILIKEVSPDENAMDKRFKLTVKSATAYEIYDIDGNLICSGTMNTPTRFLNSQLVIELNKKVIDEKKGIKIIDNYEFEFLSKEKLLQKINKNIDIVSVDKDVPVIRINIKSNIPAKASIFVNKLAETYIYDYIETKYQAANTTVKFLNTQIDDAGKKLTNSENTIENYRNENGITNIKQETETDLRKISQLKIQQTNLKMNLEAIDELNRYISSGKENFLSLAPNFEAFTDLLSTEIIKNIKKLQADKKDLLITFTANDERVIVIDAKIKDLTNYLIESINNTRINLQIKYDQISNDIRAAEQVFVTVPEKEKNMTIMDREFNLLQTSYNFLNEKKIEAEIAQSAKISFHRIITPAVEANKPISPNRPVIIILSAIFGMIASIVLIYLVHIIKAKVNDISAIEKSSTIPVAVSTPYNKTHDLSIFTKNVLQLELKGILAKQKILVITSNEKCEGKSYNLLNIARVLSAQKRSVVIIDAQGDLQYLKNNDHPNTGVSGTCIDSVSYTNISSPEYSNYSNEMMIRLVNSLKRSGDFVIINNAFFKEESKALLFMSLADNNLFIVDTRKTSLKLIQKLDLLKSEFNIPNISFLINRIGYNPTILSDIAFQIKKIIGK